MMPSLLNVKERYSMAACDSACDLGASSGAGILSEG